MPYICLIRNDVPDGSIFIKSLRSESQRIPSIDPPGQARYVNRVQNEMVYVGTDGSISQDAYGLAAYLADRLEPGGLGVATGTVEAAGPVVGDTLTVGGVVFTAAESLGTGTLTMDGPHNGDTVSVKGVVFTAVENFAVGDVQAINTPSNGDTVTIKGVVFNCVEKPGIGTVQMVAPAEADTVTIKTVQFNCVDNYAVGTLTINAGCTAAETLTINGVLYTAVNPGPSGANQWIDAQAPNTPATSAADLATNINLDAVLSLIVTASNVPGSPVVTLTANAVRGLGGIYTSVPSVPANITVVPMACPAVDPTHPARQYEGVLQSGSAIASASSLMAAINDVSNQAQFELVAPLGDGVNASTLGMDTVTLQSDTLGLLGNYALVESTAGVRQIVSGANFVVAPVNPAIRQFEGLLQTAGGLLSEVATSLAVAINDATPVTGGQTLILAAAPNGVGCAAASGGTDTVTLTASARGVQGEFALAENTVGANFTLSGAAMVSIPADTTNCEFDGILQVTGGMNADVANSLAAAINDLTAVTGGQTLILAAAPATVGCTAVPIVASVVLTADAPGAQGEFALAESTADARVHLSGATMVSIEPHPGLQEFASLIEAGSNALVAQSIQDTINHANSQTLILAANGGNTCACGAPVGAVVTLTAGTSGQLGAFTLEVSDPLTLVLSGDHMVRSFETWTASNQMTLMAESIIARMDAGLTLTTGAVDVLINAVPGVSDTSISSPGSTTTLADILSILAGRGYYIAKGTLKVINSYTWDTTPGDGFAKPYVKVDSRMLGGELRPFAIGGDPATKEFRPIRHTYLSDELIVSMDEGEVAVFLAKPGMPPVTLWPRSGLVPQLTWAYQKAILNPKTEVLNTKLITIYDDDGTILV